MEALGVREHIINFLQAAVVFLLLTNAISMFAAACAIHLASDRAGVRLLPAVVNAIATCCCAAGADSTRGTFMLDS